MAMRGSPVHLIPLLMAVVLALAACAAPPPPSPAPVPAPAPAPAPGVPGVPDLDASCRVDSDCAVRNVGNCCGYFPACLNKDAKPDPAAVQAGCAASGMTSVCGFREIQACACVANACQPAASDGALPGGTLR